MYEYHRESRGPPSGKRPGCLDESELKKVNCEWFRGPFPRGAAGATQSKTDGCRGKSASRDRSTKRREFGLGNTLLGQILLIDSTKTKMEEKKGKKSRGGNGGKVEKSKDKGRL